MLRNKKSYLIPIVGFATIILISAIILYLPICNLTQLNFRNILYITTSAITTCGLSKGSVVQQFSFLGQVVIAILMEIGALGFIILAFIGLIGSGVFFGNILEKGNPGDLFSSGSIFLMNFAVGFKVFAGISFLILIMISSLKGKGEE